MEYPEIKKPWEENTEAIFASLATSPQGLSEEEAKNRLSLYGENSFKKTKDRGPIKILLSQFSSPLIFVLLGASIITLILREWIDSIVIVLAVVVNAVLGFYQEYHAGNTLSKLSTYIKERARVVRSGAETEIDSALLVPGDIVRLSYGARVPADMRIISEQGLSINESVLTGESVPVLKENISLSGDPIVAEQKNIAFAGTFIADGYGSGVVIRTGSRTEIGNIAKLVSAASQEVTPIQKSLSKIAWLIFIVVSVIVVGIFVLGILRGENIFDMLLLSAAVSVGAIPEALPIALTVILAIGAERIAKNKGVTRTLVAAETLGSTTLIMTDKTGTLTQADMKLTSILTGSELFSENSRLGIIEGTLSEAQRQLLSIALSSSDVAIENPNDKEESWILRGRPFEVNIAKSAREHKISLSLLSQKIPPVIAFNSTHKFSAWIFEDRVMVMGAPDILIARSELNSSLKNKAENLIHSISVDGGRLIGIASLPLSPDVYENGKITINSIKNIELEGLFVFHDPIRPEVPEAIRSIEALGTKVVMITGDLKGTALSVARELGWTVDDSHVISGDELRTLSDEDLLKRLPDTKIFARVTPEDKLRVGNLYKRLGEVVAMTGDGVNDAPSLKAMDVGVALGSGSDVAKSAADIVLLDDNFKTIAQAVEEGRRILANIRKTFVYLMSNCLDEVILVGGSLIASLPLPLTTLQIIWVNLCTGSLPALAFAFDEDYDKQKAGVRSITSLLSKEVRILTLGIGIVTSLILFGLYYVLLRSGFEISVARSILFVCFSTYILAIAFSFRSLHRPLFSYPLFSNKKLNMSIVIALVLLVFTMTVPKMREIFSLAPLSLSHAWIVVSWLVLNILIIEGAKLWFRIAYKRNEII